MQVLDRIIQPPPRSTRAGTFVILCTALLLSVDPFVPELRSWTALASAFLVVGAVRGRQGEAFSAAFLVLLLTSLPLAHPVLARWPWHHLIPLFLLFAVMLAAPQLRAVPGWMRPGRIDRSVVLIGLVVSAGAAPALVLWHRLAMPDLSVHLRSFPDLPAWLVPLAGLAFSAGNALVEEFLYRGVLMQAFDSALGPGTVSVLLQAWLFGAMHYLHGFPNGAAGVQLAVLYGLLLGVLRRRSGGMAAPWLTHAAADLVIFIIVAQASAGGGS